MKKIVLSLCLILLGASMLSGCTKDEFLDQYNNIVQSAGSIALTGNSSLQGTKEKGIDDYTGSYTANYEDFSDTEYLFVLSSIKREAGKDLSIDCALEVTEGTAKVFWISGADEAVTLLGSGKDSGRYVFQPLAPGTQPISWPGGFQFDLTVCEERSEPPWT